MTEEKSTYGPATTTSAANGNQAGLVNSATGAAGALAGWAIASIGKQMSTTETHSTMSAASASSTAAVQSGMASAASSSKTAQPRTSSDAFSFGATPSESRINVRKAPPARVAASAASMKLGGTKPKATKASLADTLADEWDEGDDEVENAWGNDDLIDVNADEDDWAAFESAPVPEITAPPAQSYYVKPAATPASAPAPKPTPVARAAPVVRAPPVLAPQISTAASPVVASNDDWGEVDSPTADSPVIPSAASAVSAQPSLVGMSKEEKDKEMARRREERKAVSLVTRSVGISLIPAYSSDEGAEKAESVRRWDGFRRRVWMVMDSVKRAGLSASIYGTSSGSCCHVSSDGLLRRTISLRAVM